MVRALGSNGSKLSPGLSPLLDSLFGVSKVIFSGDARFETASPVSGAA